MTQPGHIPRLKLEDPKAWAALLDPGEELLWPARPTLPRLQKLRRNIWMLLALPVALTTGLVAFLPDATTGTILGAGIGAALALCLWWFSGAVRAHFTTLYTVTSQRAIISRAPLGRSGWVDSESWDIPPDMPLSLTYGPDATMLQFATREVQGKRGTRTVPVGFERLENGAHVMALMRKVQAKATS